METIKKTVEINADREKVWKVLTDDKFTRAWYSAFGTGVHAETNWEVGSKALFKDNANDGLVSKIVVNKPNETLSIEHLGQLVGGVEDYDSEIAVQLKGAMENYQLTEANGVSLLSVECDMAPEMFEFMSLAWDKALQKVKELAES